MAEYHVGCGITGIFAGTLNKSGDMWKNKSDVTHEAFSVVAQYCLEHNESMSFGYKGKQYRLEVREQSCDVISREGAREAYKHGILTGSMTDIINDIEKLPSVVPVSKTEAVMIQDTGYKDYISLPKNPTEDYKKGYDDGFRDGMRAQAYHDQLCEEEKEEAAAKEVEKMFFDATLPDDWMDIEADLLTPEQARKAVRELRKKLIMKNDISTDQLLKTVLALYDMYDGERKFMFGTADIAYILRNWDIKTIIEKLKSVKYTG